MQNFETKILYSQFWLAPMNLAIIKNHHCNIFTYNETICHCKLWVKVKVNVQFLSIQIYKSIKIHRALVLHFRLCVFKALFIDLLLLQQRHYFFKQPVVAIFFGIQILSLYWRLLLKHKYLEIVYWIAYVYWLSKEGRAYN